MKKVILAGVFVLLAGFVFGQNEAEKIRVGVLNGPSAVPAAWIMKNSASAEVTKYADPQALLPKLIKKEVDVGFLPVNVAAKVYNSTNGTIICTGITGNGNLSVVSKSELNRFSDLKNKTVYVAGQGATPEYMFKYLLEQNGLVPGKDVTLEYSIPTAQLAANLISNKISVAVMPEPFTSIALTKSKEVKARLNLQTEYKAFSENNETFPLTVMVVRKAYAEENSEQLEEFLMEYKKALEWTVNNPKSSGELVEKMDLGLTAAVVTKAIPNSNYVYISSQNGKKNIESLLKIFLKYSPESIGGQLPAQDFYYEKKNP